MTGTGDDWTLVAPGEERLARRARLGAVTRFVQRVSEQVEARLAGGEAAAVAWPEALRHELERLRHGTDE